MSRHLSTFAARLRRELLQRPKFSAKPRCPACGEERELKGFAKSGLCTRCEDERRLEYEVRMHAELWPDGSPRVERTRGDAFDSDKPFLPDEDAEDR